MLVDNRVRNYEIAVRPPGVRIIAIDKGRGLIYLTREYRTETSNWDWRVPGGKVFDDIDSYLPYYDPHEPAVSDDLLSLVKDAAIKEADEELGVELSDLRLLGRSVCGATVHWDLFYWIGQVEKQGTNRPEDGELIEVSPVQWSRALDIVDGGEMQEDGSAIWLRRSLIKLLEDTHD